MAGINHLGGAQAMVQADTGVREAQQVGVPVGPQGRGTQEASGDAVQATREISAQEQTNPDGRGNGSRQFSQLARRARRPDPLTGDLLSIGMDNSFDLSKLEAPKLSLVATEGELSKKQMLERALTDVFAQPAPNKISRS